MIEQEVFMQDDAASLGQRHNLRHLWAFCRVVELHSISRAAEVINLSQPAISQGIALLEDRFEDPLLRRDPSGVHPTEAGLVLHARLLRGFAALGDALDRENICTEVSGETLSVLFRSSQLSTLIALAGGRTVPEGALALGVSKKSVARTIRDLEHRLGFALMLKDAGVMRLSNAGERIAREAKIFFREIDLAKEEIAAARGLSEGRLVIGGLPLVRSFILPNAMVQFASSFSDMSVRLLEGSDESLLARLRDGDVDIMVGALRPDLDPAEFAQSVLFKEHLCVVARVDHPVFQKPRIDRADLFSFPWIAPRSGSPARQEFDDLMGRSAQTPRVLMEVASHIAVRSVLLESDALALLSRHQIRYEVLHGQLAVVPVVLDHWPRDIGYVVRADWQATPPQKRFLSILQDTIGLSLSTG